MKKVSLIQQISLFVVFTFLSVTLFAQEEIGGPYTVDENTVLLLHFDGNLNNESSFSEDGIGHGNYTFFPVSVYTELSQSLRFDNDAISDSSYVTVPDTSYLDLTGDWTIEGWINVFTYGESSGDHRWVPRLVIKPGDEDFWRPNYFVELWGDRRFFSCGYQTNSQDQWPQVNTPDNFATPGQWVHLTFIRDTSRHILISMVHNDNRELISFNVADYLSFGAEDPTPITTSQPVTIGFAGGGEDSWLDGFVDEIRISNVVRNFAVPPIITYLYQVPNQEASVISYEVKANVFPFSPTGTIQSATLYYSIDDGNTWTSVPMTEAEGDTMIGIIPQQAVGTIVKYYMSATDDQGLSSNYPSQGEDNPLSFGVYQPNSQILDLTFEEGSGEIIDHSLYNQKVTYYRGPFYSSDAVVGSWSYEFPSSEDSSFLAIDSPFLTAKEFAIDFWFKPEGDTILPFIRIIIRSADGSHVNQNYYIRTEELNGISAAYQVDPNVETRTKDNVVLSMPAGTLQPNKWFHAQFERSDSLAIFKLYDENNNLIGKAYDAEDIALNPPRPGLTPLRIGWAGNFWDGTIRNFHGKMDDIKIWNYAALGLDTTGIVDVDERYENIIPATFDLYQNYPNPFNPSTVIKYQLPESGIVNLVVYNVLGKEVVELVNEFQPAGIYELTWDGKTKSGEKIASGIYFYRLSYQDKIITKKMIMLK